MGFGSWALTRVLSRTVSRGHVEVRARKQEQEHAGPRGAGLGSEGFSVAPAGCS